MAIREQRPDDRFSLAGLNLSRCLQCGRCSATCPKAFHSAHSPRQVIRLLQWGWSGLAEGSPFLRACKQCQDCTVVCPQGVDVSGAVRTLVWTRFIDRF